MKKALSLFVVSVFLVTSSTQPLNAAMSSRTRKCLGITGALAVVVAALVGAYNGGYLPAMVPAQPSGDDAGMGIAAGSSDAEVTEKEATNMVRIQLGRLGILNTTRQNEIITAVLARLDCIDEASIHAAIDAVLRSNNNDHSANVGGSDDDTCGLDENTE